MLVSRNNIPNYTNTNTNSNSIIDEYKQNTRQFMEKNGSDDFLIKKLIDSLDLDDLDKNFRIIQNICQHGSLESLKYLISKGVDITFEDIENSTIFHYVIESNDLEKVKYFVEEINILSSSMNFEGIMTFVVGEAEFPIFKYLFEKLSENNIEISSSYNAMFESVVNQGFCVDTTLYLIDKCNLNYINHAGGRFCIINQVCMKQNLTVLKALVEKGAWFNLDEKGAWFNLDEKSDLGKLDNQHTPLHICAGAEKFNDVMRIYTETYSFYDMTKYLLSKGANPNVMNNDSLYPIHVAMQESNESVANLLFEHTSVDIVDGKGNKLIYYAFKYQHLDIIQKLVGMNVNLEEDTTEGNKLVHLLTDYKLSDESDFKNFCNIIDYLFSIGLDFETETKDGERLIHLLCRKSIYDKYFLKQIKYLIEKGVDFSAKTKKDETILSILYKNKNNYKDNDDKIYFLETMVDIFMKQSRKRKFDEI